MTHEPVEQVVSIINALKNKTQVSIENIKQGKTIGFSLVIFFIMNLLHIVKAFEKSFESKIALMLIAARVMIQSSRLQALYWSKKTDHILDIVCFSEKEKKRLDDKTIYSGLDYLYKNQQAIENKLFKLNYKNSKPQRVYYDVTSSYVEGEYEDSLLVKYRYNRDKKEGKKQIVIGLLTDEKGRAISVDVYPGNTNDIRTFSNQLQKLKQRFNLNNITIVGDGGMIKSKDIETIKQMGYDYITTIPKDTIKSMCKDETSKMDCSLFDNDLKEFVENNTRYILRLNPFKQQEIRENRENKIKRLNEYIEDKKDYYNTHYRTKKETFEKRLDNFVKKLKLDSFVSVSVEYEEKEIEVLNWKFHKHSSTYFTFYLPPFSQNAFHRFHFLPSTF